MSLSPNRLTMLNIGLVVAVMCSTLFPVVGGAQQVLPAATPSDDAAAAAAIESLAKSRFKADEPGATIIATRNGKTVFRKAYGLADIAAKTPLKPDDVLRIGSVTKQFTAVGILMLADEGKLALGDDVSKYVPTFTSKSKPVTIEHLLTHTSGIPNFTDDAEYRINRGKLSSQAEVVARFKDLPLSFEPGSRWAYSNSGYFLLGMVIEKVSGKRYADFLAEKIFNPLGMENTAYEGFERSAKRRVEGYQDADGKFSIAQKIDMSVPFSAGAMVSTVDDLARWDAAITAGKLLKPETWKKAFTAYTLTDGKKTTYGYGWGIVKVQGKDAITHTGGIDGFASVATHVPGDKVFVAVLRNSIGGSSNHTDLATRTAAILVGRPMREFTQIKIAPNVFDAYVGRYELGPNFVLRVYREGNRFMTQATGQGPVEVFAETEDKFFLRVVEAQIKFVRSAAGKVESLVLFQGGREMPAKRLPDEPVVARKEVSLSAAQLDKLVGEYPLAVGFVLSVFRDGETLLARATGQGAFQLFAESEEKFFAKVADIRVEFKKDAAGNVTGLVLFQAGMETPAKKN
jgi:D-alanyl-D-alanine carboxypeptidase